MKTFYLILIILFFSSCADNKNIKSSFEDTGYDTANLLQKEDNVLCFKLRSQDNNLSFFQSFTEGTKFKIASEILKVSPYDLSFPIPNNCLFVERSVDGSKSEDVIKTGTPIFIQVENN